LQAVEIRLGELNRLFQRCLADDESGSKEVEEKERLLDELTNSYDAVLKRKAETVDFY